MRYAIHLEDLIESFDSTSLVIQGMRVRKKEIGSLEIVLTVSRPAMDKRLAEYYGRKFWKGIIAIFTPERTGCKGKITVEWDKEEKKVYAEIHLSCDHISFFLRGEELTNIDTYPAPRDILMKETI